MEQQYQEDLEDILFNDTNRKNKQQSKTKEELQNLIEEIPFPNEDLSMTSFSNNSKHNHGASNNQDVSHNKYNYVNSQKQFSSSQIVPNVGIKKQQVNKSINYYHENQNDSFQENNNMDWSKQYVQAQSKHVFPQVIAPSIDFSHENAFNTNHFYHSEEKDYYNQQQQPNQYYHHNQQSQTTQPHQNHLQTSQLQQNHLQTSQLQQNHLQSSQLQQNHLQSSQIQQCNNNYQQQLRRQELQSEQLYNQQMMNQLMEMNQQKSDKINELEEKIILLNEKYKVEESNIELLRGQQLQQSRISNKQLQHQLVVKQNELNDWMMKYEQLEREYRQKKDDGQCSYEQQLEQKDQLLRVQRRQIDEQQENHRQLQQEIQGKLTQYMEQIEYLQNQQKHQQMNNEQMRSMMEMREKENERLVVRIREYQEREEQQIYEQKEQVYEQKEQMDDEQKVVDRIAGEIGLIGVNGVDGLVQLIKQYMDHSKQYMDHSKQNEQEYQIKMNEQYEQMRVGLEQQYQ